MRGAPPDSGCAGAAVGRLTPQWGDGMKPRSGHVGFTTLVLIAITSAAAVATVVLLLRPAPAGTPALAYPEHIDLGPQEFGTTAVCRFKLSNLGAAELYLDHFQTSCACAGVEIEKDGRFQRLESVAIPAGGHAEVAVRIAVGARPGTEQRVHVLFRSNDPERPEGSIRVDISRVLGGVFADPSAFVFGEVKAGESVVRTVLLYDNGISSRRVKELRSSHPERFEVALIPPMPGVHEPQEHPTAGHLIAVAEVRPRTGWVGRMDGFVEVVVTDRQTPDRIDVIGEVIGDIICRPDVVVLPWRVGDRPEYSAESVVSSRDNRPIRIEGDSSRRDLKVTIIPNPSDPARVTVRVDYAPGESTTDHMPAATVNARVRLRVRIDDRDERTVEIPVILTSRSP